jgi:GDP-L-fucose synthase
MKKTSKIYVAGHTGLVGSAIIRKLKSKGHKNIRVFNHKELDLTDKSATETMFRICRPRYVILAAARVGGIHANNTKSGEFFYDNIMIQTNVMEAARKYGTKKLLFLGSSCIYPKKAPQPIKEEYLMTSHLESTNSGYATAKIAGIEMCKSYRKQWGCDFISVMPCNLYGPGDSFSLMDSHVLPAFIRKFHDAKMNGIPQVEIWGDGTPKREFMYVDDAAEVLYFLMQYYDEKNHINIGTGEDVPISFLAKMIKNIVGYEGKICWNKSYPNGTMRKLLDNSRIQSLGWKPEISLEQGIKETYEWFVENYKNIRK